VARSTDHQQSQTSHVWTPRQTKPTAETQARKEGPRPTNSTKRHLTTISKHTHDHNNDITHQTRRECITIADESITKTSRLHSYSHGNNASTNKQQTTRIAADYNDYYETECNHATRTESSTNLAPISQGDTSQQHDQPSNMIKDGSDRKARVTCNRKHHEED